MFLWFTVAGLRGVGGRVAARVAAVAVAGVRGGVRADLPAAAGQPPDPDPVRVRGAGRGRARPGGGAAARARARRRRSRSRSAALGVGWLQQLHRVDLFREPENPSLVAAAARLESLTRPDDRVVVDQPIVAFLADRRVPPQLVDTANSRFESGSLTVADVLRAVDDDPRVTAAVAGRSFFERPALMAGLDERVREAPRPRVRGDLLRPPLRLGFLEQQHRNAVAHREDEPARRTQEPVALALQRPVAARAREQREELVVERAHAGRRARIMPCSLSDSRPGTTRSTRSTASPAW